MDVFQGFGIEEWVLFGFYLFITFGVLNGLYNVSRLMKRGALPLHLWAFNGFVAIIIAAAIASRGF